MCANLFDINFSLKYIDSWNQLTEYQEKCNNIIDRSFDLDLDDVSKLFLTATNNLVNGDAYTVKKEYKRAIEAFEDANRKFMSLLSNQSITSELLQESRRRAIYAQSRQFYAQALSYLKENKDLEIIINVLQKAAEKAKQEIKLDTKNNDFYHLILAIRLLTTIFMRIAIFRARIESQGQNDPRSYYYSAIENAKKAMFVGAEVEKNKARIEKWQKKIDEATIDSYIKRCELLFEEAIELAKQERHKQSARKFWHASQYYKHIQKIRKSQELILQQSLMESGCYEQIGKNLMLEDKNKEAASFFIQSQSILSETIKTMREYGESNIVIFLSVQKEFYEEMASFCEAIQLFDDGELQNALEQLEMTFDAIKETLKRAEKVNNTSVVYSAEKAIEQAGSYIDSIKLML